MKITRLGAVVAAAALTLTFAGTAFANNLHQTPPIVGTEFGNTEIGCNEGWHFVHTGTSGANLPSELTATFQNAGVVKAQGYSNGNGSAIVMYDVHVDAGDTLLGASDTIVNGGLLNLSHVCVDETTTTTTETTTTTTETTTTTTDETTTESTTTTTDETTTDSTTDETTTDSTTDETTTDSTTDETTTDETTEETTTTTPGGEVEELTPPSTDAIAQPTSGSTVSTSLLLIVAGILAAAMVVIPAAARSRR